MEFERDKKKVIVASCGAFDGEIHPGHINFLTKAKGEGDILYVFVVPDEIILRNKNRHPIHTQKERVNRVAALTVVDRAIALSGSDTDQLIQIEEVIPGVFCFGEDQNRQFDSELEQRLVKYSTKIVRVPRFEPERYSTTSQLVDRRTNSA